MEQPVAATVEADIPGPIPEMRWPWITLHSEPNEPPSYIDSRTIIAINTPDDLQRRQQPLARTILHLAGSTHPVWCTETIPEVLDLMVEPEAAANEYTLGEGEYVHVPYSPDMQQREDVHEQCLKLGTLSRVLDVLNGSQPGSDGGAIGDMLTTTAKIAGKPDSLHDMARNECLGAIYDTVRAMRGGEKLPPPAP